MGHHCPHPPYQNSPTLSPLDFLICLSSNSANTELYYLHLHQANRHRYTDQFDSLICLIYANTYLNHINMVCAHLEGFILSLLYGKRGLTAPTNKHGRGNSQSIHTQRAEIIDPKKIILTNFHFSSLEMDEMKCNYRNIAVLKRITITIAIAITCIRHTVWKPHNKKSAPVFHFPCAGVGAIDPDQGNVPISNSHVPGSQLVPSTNSLVPGGKPQV